MIEASQHCLTGACAGRTREARRRNTDDHEGTPEARSNPGADKGQVRLWKRRCFTAKITYAPAVKHLHGHLGDMVFKERMGQDIVASKPDQANQPNSPA